MKSKAGREAGVYGESNEPIVGLWASRDSEENRYYSWLEDYLVWLKGKETRHDYHALLGQ